MIAAPNQAIAERNSKTTAAKEKVRYTTPPQQKAGEVPQLRYAGKHLAFHVASTSRTS